MGPEKTGITSYWSLLVFLLLTNPSSCPVSGATSSLSHDLVKEVVDAVTTDYVGTDHEDPHSSSTDPLFSASLNKIEETLFKTLDDVAEEMLSSIRKTQGLDDKTESTTTASEFRQRGSGTESTNDDEREEEVQGDQPVVTKRMGKKSSRPPTQVMVQRIKGIVPLFSACDGSHHVSTIVFNGATIGVCVSARGRPVVIGEISLSATKFAQREVLSDHVDPRMSAIFEASGKLHVLIADAAKQGVRMYTLDTKSLKTDKEESRNVIHSHFPTALVIWQINSEYHLAVGNSPAPSSSTSSFSRSSFKNETFFYTFQASYFDYYASVESYHVKDICPFSVGGKDYIVVINFEAGVNSLQVDSEVFRFNANDKKWESVQRIKTTGAVDCEVFSMGVEPRGEIFLAIANSMDRTHSGVKYDIDSVIYKFSNEKFVPFQCLKTVAATQIKAFDADQNHGIFALAVSHSLGVQMFQYNGWRFIPTTVQLTQGSMGPGVAFLSFTRLGELPVLLVANPLRPREKNVIDLEFEPNNFLSNWKKKSLDWCSRARSLDVQKSLKDLEKSLSQDVFFVDQKDPIRIKGDLIFNSPMVDIQGIFSAPSVFNVEENTHFDHKMTHELEEVDRLLLDLEAQAKKIQGILSRALRLDAPHQVVTGQYSFSNDIEFKCGAGAIGTSYDVCNFRDIHTKTLNGKDVTKLAEEVIRIDRDQVINRNDIFFKNLEVAGNLRILGSGLVNGINVSQVVTKTGTHFIEAPTTLRGPVSTNAISVSGLINGAKIDSNSILLKSGNQEIRSQLIFKDVSAKNVNVSVVNGVPFNDLLSKIVTTDGTHVITGTKEFKNQVEIQGNLDLVPGTRVSEVDILNLWKNILWSHGDQEIRTPHISFSNLKIAGDLRVESGLINGVQVPGENMIINRPSASPVVITAPKIFTAPVVKVDHMHVKKSINGIETLEAVEGLGPISTEWPDQLDILIKSRAQTIPSHKTFRNSIHLGGHSTLEGTVSGVDLSQLEQMALKHNETNELSGRYTFDGMTTFNNKLTVQGLVDGVNLTHLYTNSLKLSDEVISSSTVFKFDHIVAEEIKCQTVNGLKVEEDFMTRSTPQVIKGAKTFPQGLHVIRDFPLTGTLNGIDISFMNDSLLRSMDQSVFGPKTIVGDLYINNLVTSSLNGINMNDLILINSDEPQIISGKKIFQSIRVSGSSVNVSNLEVGNDINRVKVKDLFENTMLYDTPQEVIGVKHFDQIEIPLGGNLNADSVNGYRLRDIIRDAVYLDEDQDISGDKIFNSPSVHFKELNFKKTFDGISEDVIKRNWLLQGVDQTIEGDIIFKDVRPPEARKSPLVVVKGNLWIENGTLNGHDIRQLQNFIVKKNEPATIEGVVTFKGTVTSEGDVDVSGKTQGIKLSTEALRKRYTNEQGVIPIFGKKIFKKNVVVDENLVVNGRVDGVFIDDLCRTAVRIFGDQIITAPVTVKGSVTVGSPLTAEGLIDGVDVKQLQQGCLLRNFPGVQTVRGKKHFKSLVLMAPSTVQGKFGGIQLKELNDTYLSLTRNQIVRTPIAFMNGVTFEADAFIHGNINTKDNLIRSSKSASVVDLKFVDDNSLKIYGDQVIKGPMTFKDEVYFSQNVEVVQTKVNGIPFDWMMLKTRQRQEVKTPVIFNTDVNVQRDVDVSEGSSVAGVDMSLIRRSMVDSSAGHPGILGKKNFSIMSVDHLIVKGLLNGIHFSPQNILLSNPNISQMITGKTTFNEDLSIAGSLKTQSINGVDLHRMKNSLVLNGVPGGNTISAPKTFEGPVQANDVWTINLIDGVNITNVKDNVYDIRFETELKSLDNRLNFQEKKLDKLERVLQNQVNCVDHYRISSSVNGTLVSSNSKDYLFVKSPGHCSVLFVYRLVPAGNAIPVTRIEGVYRPKKVVVVDERTFIVPSIGLMTNANEVFKTCLNPSLKPSTDLSGKSFLHVISLTRHELSNKVMTSGQVVRLIPLKTTSVITDSVFVSSHPSSSPRDSTCLAVSGSPHSQIICLPSNPTAAVYQKDLSSSTGSAVVTSLSTAWIHEERSMILALTHITHINFFSWNPSQRSLESTPLQKILIQAPDPQTLPVTHMTSRSTLGLFFIVSEAKSRRIRDRSPLIRVFQHQTKGVSVLTFLETQQMTETNDILAIDSLLSSSDENLNLYFLTDDDRVKIFKLKGSSGFVLTDSIEGQSLFSSSLGVRSLSVIPSAFMTGHFVVLSSSENSVADEGISFLPASSSAPVGPETKVLFSVVQNRFVPGVN